MPTVWCVHKFGGTSLADAERIRAAADLSLAAAQDRHLAIVVSAMAGVTDRLIGAVRVAAARESGAEHALEQALATNLEAAEALLAPAAAGDYRARLIADAEDLKAVLKGVEIARAAAESTEELVAGYGELWSARLLCALLRARGADTVFLDAREVLVVEQEATGPVVDWDVTRARFGPWLAGNGDRLLVVTGYVAADRGGAPTTLKRNGSDFSAAIFAALLGAEDITIWTDVDGVLSADPRRVPEAVVLSQLSYDEAMELAYFGAKVLHPHTMGPALQNGIPIRIRNASRPEAPGTLIAPATGTATMPGAVKGFSSNDDIAVLNIEGAGMIGVPGIASRLFSALQDVGVSVVMISQASSEHSICVGVPAAQGETARAAVARAFAVELHHGQIQTVALSGPHGIVAAVGDGMVQTPGVAARFFGALYEAGVNVRAIAQGSSERNISAVVAGKDTARALRAVHAGFYLSDRTLSLGLIGTGQIGSALMRQLRNRQESLHARFRIDFRVRAVANSRLMARDEVGIDLTRWTERLEAGEDLQLEALVEHVHAAHLPHAVLVDCTASSAVAGRYADWLNRGIHVVTPNKRANSAALADYRRLRELDLSRAHYLYEATVGAGLPVITTLRDLVETGDRILRIEGVLSGTLSFLFHSFTGQRPFSAAVAEARRRGYTEPDLRDDLSGMDVARKAVILGREAGLPLELSDVETESLVPDELRAVAGAAELLDGLRECDEHWARARQAADADGQVLRYAAVVDADGRAAVGVRRYPIDHPFARLRGADNVVAFTTERYREQPLLVQGPGAGPEVTAGGVFADLLRLAAYLGGGRS